MTHKLTGTYSGSIRTTLGLIEYIVNCECSYYYDPGRMYMPNGDPGYPPEESYDDIAITDIEEYTVYDTDGNEIPEGPFYDEHRQDIERAIREDFDDVDDSDISWDEYDEYDEYEPEWEPDDYDE